MNESNDSGGNADCIDEVVDSAEEQPYKDRVLGLPPLDGGMRHTIGLTLPSYHVPGDDLVIADAFAGYYTDVTPVYLRYRDGIEEAFSYFGFDVAINERDDFDERGNFVVHKRSNLATNPNLDLGDCSVDLFHTHMPSFYDPNGTITLEEDTNFDYARFFQEVQRVLKPSGRFIFSHDNNIYDGYSSERTNYGSMIDALNRTFTKVAEYHQNNQATEGARRYYDSTTDPVINPATFSVIDKVSIFRILEAIQAQSVEPTTSPTT